MPPTFWNLVYHQVWPAGSYRLPNLPERTSMQTDAMTPRERWLAVLKRQAPDRTPSDYWGTPETGEKIRRHFGTASLFEALDCLHVDYPITVGPRYTGPAR